MYCVPVQLILLALILDLNEFSASVVHKLTRWRVCWIAEVCRIVNSTLYRTANVQATCVRGSSLGVLHRRRRRITRLRNLPLELSDPDQRRGEVRFRLSLDRPRIVLGRDRVDWRRLSRHSESDREPAIRSVKELGWQHTIKCCEGTKMLQMTLTDTIYGFMSSRIEVEGLSAH